MDARVGRRLGGKWHVTARIGEGATSTVYAATHRDGRSAAIKVLRASLASDPGMVERFAEEARVARAVDHPGVVRVLDDGIADDGCPFLVLELLVGRTLEEVRQASGGRVPLDEAIRIGLAMMEALEAVHDAGIVHRDLKPQNVVVLEGGSVKLVDFGVASEHPSAGKASASASLGHVVGTPSFMPPEQALGLTDKMDAQSDIWALGATLFQVLSGQPVHLAKHPSAMLLASASTRPRSLADAAPELPRAIVAVVDRALAFRKADRFRDVRAMRAAWLEAHPPWLPTLPPPSFAADPAWLDPALLVAEAAGDDTRDLFDPREILGEDPDAPSVAPHGVRAHPVAFPSSPAPRASTTTFATFAAAAAAAVTAATLAAATLSLAALAVSLAW